MSEPCGNRVKQWMSVEGGGTIGVMGEVSAESRRTQKHRKKSYGKEFKVMLISANCFLISSSYDACEELNGRIYGL